MEKLTNLKAALLSFSLFPLGYKYGEANLESFKEKISQYQNTGQKTDRENISKDWRAVGDYIRKSINKVEESV